MTVGRHCACSLLRHIASHKQESYTLTHTHTRTHERQAFAGTRVAGTEVTGTSTLLDSPRSSVAGAPPSCPWPQLLGPHPCAIQWAQKHPITQKQRSQRRSPAQAGAARMQSQMGINGGARRGTLVATICALCHLWHLWPPCTLPFVHHQLGALILAPVSAPSHLAAYPPWHLQALP